MSLKISLPACPSAALTLAAVSLLCCLASPMRAGSLQVSSSQPESGDASVTIGTAVAATSTGATLTNATSATATLTGLTLDGGGTLSLGGSINVSNVPVLSGSRDSMLNLLDVRTTTNSDGTLALTVGGVEFGDIFVSNFGGSISSDENSVYVVGGTVMRRVDGYDLVTFTNGAVLTVTQSGKPVTIAASVPYTYNNNNSSSGALTINGSSSVLLTGTGSLATTAFTGTGTTTLNGSNSAATIADSQSISLIDGAKVTFASGHAITLIDNGAATLADGGTLALPAGSTILPGVNSQYTLTSSGGTFTLAANTTVMLANNGGTLTLTSSSTLRLGGGGTFTVDGEVTASTLASGAALTGSVDGLNFKANADSGVEKVSATVSLTNNLDEVLHDVTARVYLSDDATLSSDDMKLVTLKLADFFAKGKIGKHKTLSMPFKHKVPAVLASYLEGKYLIVTLDAEDLDASAIRTPIVIGPIALP